MWLFERQQQIVIMKPDDVKSKSEEVKLKESGSPDSVESDADDSIDLVEQVPGLFENIKLGAQYEIQKLVGRGGMGAVYKVLDRISDKVVAIKLMQPDLAKDQTAFKRFEQEVEAASSLSHDNLVSVHGHGQTADGSPYLVMDYFEGDSLSEIVKREGALPAVRALNLFTQIAEGLSHAHDNKIIHRDVKPTNVIVSKSDDGTERARVVDFGIARVMPTTTRDTRSLTETGEVFGSPHYMSPEHCLGFLMDHRSDIYSLGCLMYEVLTGAPPFVADNPIQIVVKHINVEPTPFSPDITRDAMMRRLESVVLRCLEKDCETRYQSTEELIKDLRAISEGKDPAKFVPRKKPKAEFTRQQFIIASVGMIILGVYGFFFLLMTGFGTIQTYIFLGVGNVLAWGGSYTFIKGAIDRYRSISLGRTETGNRWTFVLLLSIAAVCSTAAPLALFAAIFNVYHPADAAWFGQLGNALKPLVYLQCFFAVSLFVSTIGWLIFGRQKSKSGISKIAIQYISIIAIMLVSLLTMFRPFASQTSFALSKTFVLDAPELSKVLLNTAIQLNPTNLDAQVYKLDNMLDDEKFDEVIKICTDQISSSKEPLDDLTEFYQLRARGYEGKKDPKMAIVDWNVVIGQEPDDAEAYVHRADQKIALGHYEEALQDLELAIRHNPDDSSPYETKAELHARFQQYSEAVKELSITIDMNTKHPDMSRMFLRGLIYTQMGMTNNAERDFDQVVSLAQSSKFLLGNESLYAAYSAFKTGKPSNVQTALLTSSQDRGYDKHSLNEDPMLKLSGITIRDW